MYYFILGVIQKMRDTLGMGVETVSPNDTRVREGVIQSVT